MAEKSTSRGEIFVVDDDPAVRETLSMVLSAGGYQVICFADGAALLAVARTRSLDFIEKPFKGSEIVVRLNEAIGAYARRQAEDSASKVSSLHFPGREPLTRREREVLEQFASGASNKEAGRELGISPRTIEDHRANIMKKLGARNAADLIRIVMTASRHS